MEKVEMHVPNKSYEGIYGGVRFSRGVGVFEDVELAKDLAKRYGYKIVEIGKEVQEKPVEVEEEKPAPKKKRKPKAKAGE